MRISVRRFACAVLLGYFGSVRAAAVDPNVLATLRQGHPRLMWTADDSATVKCIIDRDPLAKLGEQLLIKKAQPMLDPPPVLCELIGPRLLDKSRKALATLAGPLAHRRTEHAHPR